MDVTITIVGGDLVKRVDNGIAAKNNKFLTVGDWNIFD